jgi:hypothetical protein
MNISLRLSYVLPLLGVGLLFASQASALLLEDFEGATAGTPPANATVTLATGGQVTIAGSGTTPADPFGPGGNQSLYFNQPGTPFSEAVFDIPSSGVVSGTLTIRFFPDTTLGVPRAFVRLGAGSAVADWGPVFTFSTGNRSFVYDGGNVARRTTTATNIKPNEVNELTLMFDGVSRTYTGALNGVAFETETNAAQGYVGAGTFVYAGTPDALTQVVLRVGGLTGDTQVYFDDLAVIPEPGATVLVLGAAALGLLFFRGRRRTGRATSNPV